jgi:hypothetical protein
MPSNAASRVPVAFARLHDFSNLSRDFARVRARGARDNANVIYLATGAAIVPEPTTIALIALGAVAILVRQIRRLRRPRPARLP